MEPFARPNHLKTTESQAVNGDIESTNRIPSSISEWFASLPGEPRFSDTGDERDWMRGDLEAILQPAEEGHEGRLKLSRCADGSFRVEAAEREEPRKFE